MVDCLGRIISSSSSRVAGQGRDCLGNRTLEERGRAVFSVRIKVNRSNRVLLGQEQDFLDRRTRREEQGQACLARIINSSKVERGQDCLGSPMQEARELTCLDRTTSNSREWGTACLDRTTSNNRARQAEAVSLDSRLPEEQEQGCLVRTTTRARLVVVSLGNPTLATASLARITNNSQRQVQDYSDRARAQVSLDNHSNSSNLSSSQVRYSEGIPNRMDLLSGENQLANNNPSESLT